MSQAPDSKRRRWTVMVYFCADNNLAPDAVRNLNEMLQVGSSTEVQLLALADLPDVGGKTYVFRPHDANGEPRAPIVRKVADSLDTGDPRRLTGFLRWGISEFEADHYCVIIWGHANGWDEFDECRVRRLREDAGFRITAAAEILDRDEPSTLFAGTSITPDDLVEAGLLRMRDFLNNHELKAAFDTVACEVRTGECGQHRRETFTFDVVGFDACLMGMGEVAGQLSKSARYLVSSEAEIPNSSWPYGVILEDLLANPHATPEEFAALMVNSYIDSFAHNEDLEDFPATLSVLDLCEYARFAAAMSELANVLQRYAKSAFTDFAIHKCQRFARSYFANSYVDIYDFCQKLVALKMRWRAKLFELKPRNRRATAELEEIMGRELHAVVEACKGVMMAIDGQMGGEGGFVFYERHVERAAGSHGVSIFFPSISRCYPELEFSRDTGWQNFLRTYLGESLQPSPPRRRKGEDGETDERAAGGRDGENDSDRRSERS